MSDLKFQFAPRVSDDGKFSGYGAVFGNVDSHRDVIERGAFTKSLEAWRAKGRWPHMRLQHGSAGNVFRHDDLPIGRWLSLYEDRTGLWVEGQLLALETEQGKRLLSLMEGGVLDGLSIGFRPVKTRAGTGTVSRYLVEIDLREISLVDDPSNDLSRVAALSATDIAADKVRAAMAALREEAAKAAETPADRFGAALQRFKSELAKH